MKKAIIESGLAVLVVASAFLVPALGATLSTSPAKKESSWFTNYTAESFRTLAEANGPLDLKNLRPDLLDAAVFHETNHRRQQQGLPALAYSEEARKMARLQSEGMAESQMVSHENPNPALRTTQDRARAVPLRYQFLAENVASAFGRRHTSGQTFFIRTEKGQKVYSLTPKGPPIPKHTYVSFAQALLDAWMASAGHRENVLSPMATHLGCACVPAREITPMDKVYCTQVFFTPPDPSG